METRPLRINFGDETQTLIVADTGDFLFSNLNPVQASDFVGAALAKAQINLRHLTRASRCVLMLPLLHWDETEDKVTLAGVRAYYIPGLAPTQKEVIEAAIAVQEEISENRLARWLLKDEFPYPLDVSPDEEMKSSAVEDNQDKSDPKDEAAETLLRESTQRIGALYDVLEETPFDTMDASRAAAVLSLGRAIPQRYLQNNRYALRPNGDTLDIFPITGCGAPEVYIDYFTRCLAAPLGANTNYENR